MAVAGGADPVIGLFYGDAAVREDVSEIIYQPTPEDTPFYDMTGNGTIGSPYHQWLTRQIPGRRHNANFEGFTYNFTGGMTTVDPRAFNATQILNQLVRVSETEVAARHWAIDDMFADQMSIGMSGIKMDAETTLIKGTLASGASGSPQVARKMQGIIQALISSITTYTNVSGLVSLSEAQFNDAIQLCWEFGGHPSDILCGGVMKRKLSAFTGGAGANKTILAESMRLINTVSVYQTDFFTAQISLCRDIPIRAPTYTGYGLLMVDKTVVTKQFLRPWVAERAPKTADSYDGVIKGELTLEWGHYAFHNYKDMYQ